MHRRFIALVIGTALAVTGLAAAPVNAQSRGETVAIIAGAAALGIAGAALANDRKNDRHKNDVARNYGASREYYAQKHRYNYRKFQRTGERRDHRGKDYNDWRYRHENEYGRRDRYDDRGYSRGIGK